MGSRPPLPAPRRLYLAASLLACGDPSDAELPFRFEPIEQEVGPDTRPRAVVSSYTNSASGRATVDPCPSELRASLPDETAATTLVEGGGERLFDGTGALVSCRVAADVNGGDSFDIALELQHASLPRFELAGQLPSKGIGTVRLTAVLGDDIELEGQCETRIDTVLPGAVWLPSFSCTVVVAATLPPCALGGGVIFEYCRRGPPM